MLTDTIFSCVSAIQNKKAAVDRKKSLDEYQTALQKLNATCVTIDDIQASVSALKATDICTTAIFNDTTRSDILDAITNCGQGLAEGSLGNDAVSALQSAVKAASTEINALWKKAAPSYSEGTAGYLAMIAGLTDNPKEAKDLSEKIISTTTLNVTVKNINTLAEDVRKAKHITENFSLKPNIEAFLKKVSSGQASVEDLSLEVQDWLNAKGLKKKLKISF